MLTLPLAFFLTPSASIRIGHDSERFDIQAAAAAAAASTSATIPKKEQLHVGYCINGLARTFEKPIVHKSLWKNLIRPYGGQAVIFGSLTVTEERSAATTFTHHAQASPDADKVRQVLQELGAEDFIIGPDASEEDIAKARNQMFCRESLIHKPLHGALIAQLLHSSECLQMIEKYESRNQLQFDRLVFVRPDATWYKPVAHHSNLEAWPEGTIVTDNAGKDWSVFGPRSQMKSWFNRLQWSKDNQDCGLPLDQLLPVANGLKAHFERLHIDFGQKHIPVLVVRDNGEMKTAVDACQWVKGDFDDNTDVCLKSVYGNDGKGLPLDFMSGPWW